MIEAYAFLAMFTVQILAMSVLHPAWFTRYTRVKMERYYPDERFAQLFPGTEPAGVERFLTRYRALNTGIAVLGLLLLGWLFGYMRRPDWDDGPIKLLVAGYFLVQASPLALIVWARVRYLLKRSPERTRTATLQRRGLFDFVSPFIVFLAVLGYILFAAFAIYVQQDPFPGFAGASVNIGVITLVYASQAFFVYRMLYGKNVNPLETHAGRVHAIGLAVKSSIYTCIACVVFSSLSFTLVLLDLQRWEPFALSAFLVISALLASMGVAAQPRQPEADGPGSEQATHSRT